MALTTEELEQIRTVVRDEVGLSRRGWVSRFLWAWAILAAISMAAVLALHVLVIGGFTIYHLLGH
jgi:hypothetical protein